MVHATYPHAASRVTQKPPGFFSTPKKKRFPNNGMPPKREEVQVGDEKWKAWKESWNPLVRKFPEGHGDMTQLIPLT